LVVPLRFAAEQRWSVACGETAGHGDLRTKKLLSSDVDFLLRKSTSLLRSFTILIGAFPGLAPWATSLSCSAANHIDYQSADVTPIINEALLTQY
jgi:hypothetical protein